MHDLQRMAPTDQTALSDGRRRRANRLVLREVNDRISDLAVEWNETGVSLFVCECSRPGCAQALEITAAQYERIRADESLFVVFPGHEHVESERLVERSGRFVVVASPEPAEMKQRK